MVVETSLKEAEVKIIENLYDRLAAKHPQHTRDQIKRELHAKCYGMPNDEILSGIIEEELKHV